MSLVVIKLTKFLFFWKLERKSNLNLLFLSGCTLLSKMNQLVMLDLKEPLSMPSSDKERIICKIMFFATLFIYFL